MKIASKVFIIISMCMAPLSALYLFFESSIIGKVFDNANVAYTQSSLAVIVATLIILAIVSLIVVEVVGGIALKKLSVAKTKSELLPIGICTIIFCSLLGGIFMLCIPGTDL
jgi:D-alanyl-lipoteichoic acid acyltransferase DltB (MBOAT superfamily)